MNWRQGVIVGVGIVLAIALYLSRSTPEQVSAFQKQIDAAMGDLSQSQRAYLQELSAEYQNAASNRQRLVSLKEQVNAWDSMGKHVVAALYAYRTVAFDSSIHNLIHTADLLVEAGDANRGNEGEQNLTFFLYETAGSLYDQVLAKDPGHEDALIGKSLVDIQGKGQVMQGVQRLLSIVERDSLHVRANLTLGRLNMMNGQYEKAVERMNRVLKREPMNLSALTTIGNAYAAIGDVEKAIRYYEQAMNAAESPQLKNTIQNRLNELKN